MYDLLTELPLLHATVGGWLGSSVVGSLKVEVPMASLLHSIPSIFRFVVVVLTSANSPHSLWMREGGGGGGEE